MRIAQFVFGLACFLAASSCATNPETLEFGPDTPKGLALVEMINAPADDVLLGYLKFDPVSRVPASSTISWLRPTLIRTPKIHAAYFGVMDPGMYVLAETMQFGDHVIITTCLSKGTIAFEIKPRQVSYIGQFGIVAVLPGETEVPSDSRIVQGRMVQLPDDLSAAETDLAAMKMITAPLKAAERTKVQYDPKYNPRALLVPVQDC